MNIKQVSEGDWFNRHRMITVGIFLCILWFTLVYLVIREGDAVLKNPCEICAKKIGKQVLCTTVGENILIPRVIIFGGEYLNMTKNQSVNQ